MNENLRNPQSDVSLDTKSPSKSSTSKRAAIRGIPGSLWARRNCLSTLLGLTLSLTACGGSSSLPSGPDPKLPATSAGPKPSISEMPKRDCSKSPLKNQWRIYDYGQDTITIDENCSFQSFYCQSVGYIDSDVSKEVGIATVVIVWEGASGNPGCHGEGKLSCSYDARNAYYQELHLNCQ